LVGKKRGTPENPVVNVANFVAAEIQAMKKKKKARREASFP